MTDSGDLIDTPGPQRPGPAHCARLIDEAFATYNFHFRTLTRRAARRFRDRDWHGTQRDAVQRIELYDRAVRRTVARLQGQLGDDAAARELWIEIRNHYARRIRNYLDRAFHETFFNSVTRKLFATVGVDPEIEFTQADALPAGGAATGIARSYSFQGSVWQMIERALNDIAIDVGWDDFAASVAFATAGLDRAIAGHEGRRSLQALELLRPLFYRDYRAYVVGRLVNTEGYTPVVFALRHDESGLSVDGVLTSEDELSILTGFARSYFHVDLDPVRDAVMFLKSLLPRKPLGELYTALGRAKQGKTERFRVLKAHFGATGDKFVDAAFDKGMVMVVFTPRDLPVVLKVIRDRFASSKEVVRREVTDRYRLVFKHDRAGRLVDAQEFRDLKFSRDRFAPEVLEELLAEAQRTVRIEGDEIVLGHVYVERRLRPLNVYLSETTDAQRHAAVLDYGQALRDLAATNIFPGDLLLKNFGVTRHGRVIFYDYDELCLVTECNFRDMPRARTMEEEMSSDQWYYVADNDVFPEQFLSFLGLDAELAQTFRNAHAELLTAAFWRDTQQRIRRGEVFEVLPYRARVSTGT